MLDFWYILGRAIMAPDVLNQLRQAKPKFQKVNRTISENGVPVYPEGLASTSGLLEPTSTKAVRAAIQSLIPRGGCFIPTSIHAAGKMQQLLVLPEIGFDANIQQANRGFIAAAAAVNLNPATTTFSPLFPALLGAASMDANFTVSAAKGPGSEGDQILDEFGIDRTKPEMALFFNLIVNNDFQSAQGKLLNSAGWPSGCSSQLMFWQILAGTPGGPNGASVRAVLP